MTDADTRLQPDTLAVLQADDDAAPADAAPVHVTEAHPPMRVQDVPRHSASTRTIPMLSTAPTRVLTADHRRAVARIMSIGQPIYYGGSQSTATTLWPAGSPLVITSTTEVWVASMAGVTMLSVSCEFWADGADPAPSTEEGTQP